MCLDLDTTPLANLTKPPFSRISEISQHFSQCKLSSFRYPDKTFFGVLNKLNHEEHRYRLLYRFVFFVFADPLSLSNQINPIVY